MFRNLREVNWSDFDRAVWELTALLKNCEYAPLYGLPRGGLCLAVALSHSTGRELITGPQDGMIWIDDVIETGASLRKIKYKPLMTIVWFDKNGEHLTDYKVTDANHSDWLIMPWEDKKKAKSDCDEYYATN